MENFDNEKVDKQERQLDNLVNLVENHTKTKRHLEQHSHIGDKQNKENARKIQEIREEQIQDLKNQIKGIEENESPEEQLQNLKQNYRNTQNYIQNNQETIDNKMYQDLLEKQEHRREQIDFLEDEE